MPRPAAAIPPKPSADGKKKRKRKPTVRALRAVEHLLRDDVSDGVSAVAGEASTAESSAVAVS
jgi:hypothetical protein